jgi:EAL domain-containing protein (putative c-di-GMP-specific phosphodiesterase class I)
MHRNAETRRQMENDLRSALVGNGLSLNFQPIVETASETLVGFEALVRWHHPRHGEISPVSFIPIAEETGLIDGIGEWVLRNACMVAAKWPEHIGIAVNLSPIQVTNPELPALVINALAQAGLAPERLELEITESVFLEENPATRATLQRLGAIGVRLTLDDFGTGYSGFSYLTKAPFKKIKIDRSFVSGAAERGGQKAAIVKAIVALADSLGMITTAEGVETHDDLDVIRRIGCTQVQGFIFGKAVPWAEAGILARSETPIAPNGVKSTRPRRIAMLRRATILHNGRRRNARLRNTSDTGAMFEARWLPKPDDRVTTFVEGQQPRAGIVRWVEEDRFGIHYDEQLVVADIENEERAA